MTADQFTAAELDALRLAVKSSQMLAIAAGISEPRITAMRSALVKVEAGLTAGNVTLDRADALAVSDARFRASLAFTNSLAVESAAGFFSARALGNVVARQTEQSRHDSAELAELLRAIARRLRDFGYGAVRGLSAVA